MTLPTYAYNPHRHIKIWLSNNPELFMNLENQIRLIQMREINPDDLIHLVYDSILLAPTAIKELEEFCCEHTIIPIDVHGFSRQLKSNNEHTLFNFYQDEINHLHEGGNLAVASDILRWLSPIYSLGTYSDFDFPIDTSKLPALMYVMSPLLLNIGSLRLGRQEFILVNNDYIAVVDALAAQEEIKRVQLGIIKILTQYDTDFIEKTEKKLKGTFINRLILKLMKNRSETFYIIKSKEISKTLSSREMRNYILHIMSDKIAFINFNKNTLNETFQEVILKLRKNLKKQKNPVKCLFFNEEYREIKHILNQNDEDFLIYMMKKELNLYLKSIIVCTTGPIKISNALFNGYVLDSKEFSQSIQPYSYNNYYLQKAFKSRNSLPLHENVLGMLRFLGASEGELNDSSWLDSGRTLQELRVQTLKKQQNQFILNLPHSLLQIKWDIEQQITTSSNRLSKLSPKRKLQLEALKQILICFHETNNTLEFDTQRFKTILLKYPASRHKFFTAQTFNPAKKLIQSLQNISNHAIMYNVTKDRKIKVNTLC